jgi:hypothetical protein
MDTFPRDIAHMLAGTMVLVSFMLLYQDRFWRCSTSLLHASGALRLGGLAITFRMHRISTFQP